jgi:hypothetical protein
MRSIDRPSVRAIDRAIERSSDRAIDRAMKRTGLGFFVVFGWFALDALLRIGILDDSTLHLADLFVFFFISGNRFGLFKYRAGSRTSMGVSVSRIKTALQKSAYCKSQHTSTSMDAASNQVPLQKCRLLASGSCWCRKRQVLEIWHA